jgi:hypothetical protein
MKVGPIKSIVIEYDDGEIEIFTRKENDLSLEFCNTRNFFSSNYNGIYQSFDLPVIHVENTATFRWMLPLDSTEKCDRIKGKKGRTNE